MRVDVSTDDGRTWREAELDAAGLAGGAGGCGTPTSTCRPGRARVVARAWDSAAGVQPADPAEVWNPKGYVNNSWARVTLHAV